LIFSDKEASRNKLDQQSGCFSSQPMDLAPWIISNNIAHCLNALGVVKKEQPTAFVVMKMETPYTWLSFSFYESLLFFLYDPLCMSLRNVVADDPWSG